jgi:hypothetical protein
MKMQNFFRLKKVIRQGKEFAKKKEMRYDRYMSTSVSEFQIVASPQYPTIYNNWTHSMQHTRTTKSKKLSSLFGKMNDQEVSKKLIRKLMQYNMKYEEITKVILSHSERAFLDARLITLEEYYEWLQGAKKSEIEMFLASIPDYEMTPA